MRNPLVEADPLAYYGKVAPLIIRFTNGRRSTAIKGDHKTSRGEEAQLDDVEDVMAVVKRGFIDIMTSVSRNGLIDVVVFDVKGTGNLWLSEDGATVFYLAIQAIRQTLAFLGVESTLTFFDGMNGFKVMSLLSRGIDKRMAGTIVGVTWEAFTRTAKRFRVLRNNLDEVMIGGNTMLKVGMFRVPLSLHWSTKLAAVPVVDCPKNFSTIKALPQRIMDELPNYINAINELRANDVELSQLSKIDKLQLIYSLKARLSSSLTTDCT
ncbi:MAG: hypothetical protein RXR03_06480 [Thermocladium sp.]|jgi:hypothetical protein